MARLFTAASSEKITLSLGALGFAFGPGTIAAVVRTPAVWTVAGYILGVGSSNNAGYSMRFTSTGALSIDCDNTIRSPITALANSTWFLIAVTKPTGTVTVRAHAYNYAGNTVAHTESASTLANSSTPTTRAAFGVDKAGTATFWDGDIACAGVWNVVLTDSQIESLITDLGQSNWVNASGNPADCKGFWRLVDPVATSVIDRTGGGANQSAIVGTSLTVDDFALLNKSIAHAPSPAWAA